MSSSNDDDTNNNGSDDRHWTSFVDDPFDFEKGNIKDTTNKGFKLSDAILHYRNSTTQLPDNPFTVELSRQITFVMQLHEDADLSLAKKKVDSRHVLLSILLSPVLSKYVAHHFQVTHYKIKYPDIIYQLHKETRDALSYLEADLEKAKSWYTSAFKEKHQEVADGLKNLLKSMSPVAKDIGAYEYAGHLIKHLADDDDSDPSALCAHWFSINTDKVPLSQKRAYADQLHQFLSKHVKGQSRAIRSIVNHELDVGLSNNSSLRALFTFVGPSGVGKTELAKRYTQAITTLEGSHYSYRVFNMEQYSDKRAYMNLIGPGRQYSEAVHGELTKFVKFNPRSVLVFDEIEKASKEVIQSLLTMLDRGYMLDNTTQERSDFSQCIVIFTSNLGATEFASAKGIGDLDLYDVLANASYKQTDSTTTLTPEFINRLRSGVGVRFNKLNALHYVDIATNAITKMTPQLDSSFRYTFGALLPGVIAMANLPDISARGIPSALRSVLGRLNARIFEQPELANHLDKLKSVELDVDEAFFHTDTKSPILCFVGNNPDSAEQFDAGLSKYALERADNANALRGRLNRIYHYDAIVLDAEHICETELHDIIKMLEEVTQSLPVIMLGREDSLMESYDVIWKYVEPQELDSKAARIQHLLQISWHIRRCSRRNLKLDYSIKYQSGEEHVRFVIEEPSFHQLVDTKRVQRGVPGLVQERPAIGLDDVIGLQRAKSQLARSLTLLKNTDRLRHEKIKMPAGVVLTGPPGTGKTMLARAVAGETQLKFLSVNVSDLVSPLRGGGAQLIQELFDAAQDIAPSIIFIDEIDAIATRRDSDRSGDASAVNTLLTCLDGLQEHAEPVFVIAATNNPEMIDPALLRPGRLDTPIMCDLPDLAARKAFLAKFASSYEVALSEEDIESFASLTMGLSGAGMEKVFTECRTALLIERLENEGKQAQPALSLNKEMIRRAIATARFGALSESPRLGEHARKITAWHEAGHLVALKLLTPDVDVPFATIESRNQAQGFIVSQRNSESGASTCNEIKAQIAIYMAGREGERILNDDFEVTAGASHDIKMATTLAAHAVCELGLDNEVGQINLQVLSQHGLSNGGDIVHARIQHWLHEGQQQASDILKAHSALFERVANALFEHESLYSDDIERLFNSTP